MTQKTGPMDAGGAGIIASDSPYFQDDSGAFAYTSDLEDVPMLLH